MKDKMTEWAEHMIGHKVSKRLEALGIGMPFGRKIQGQGAFKTGGKRT